MSGALVRAAGGIVCRFRPDGTVEVLLVGGSRTDPGYWGFPKGKLEPGETEEVAARREVREETGIQVELLALAGISQYTFTGQDGRTHDKTVHYYLARPSGGDLSGQDGERSGVGWVAVEEAAGRLTYEDDRRHLRRVLELLEQLA